MGRLTEGFGPAGGIGRDGLLALIDEFNQRRAFRGNRERYKPEERDGVMHMGADYVARPKAANAPSPRYFERA